MNAIIPMSDLSPTTCSIHLHGKLRDHFGDTIVVPGSTVTSAIRNMLIKKPAIGFVLEQGSYRVVRGSLTGGIDLDETMLHMQIGPSRQIHIFPAAQGGGGRGGFKTILGAVIVVAAVASAVYTGGGSLAATGAAFTASGGFLGVTSLGTIALFGAALLLGGISQLIAPQPGLGASYLINGNLNTAQQGTVVPLVYGTERVGSIVVASAYSAEDYTTGTSDYEGAGAYYNASGGFSGYLDAFDTNNPLPPGATGKGGGGKSGGGGGGVEAPNTLESKAIVSIIDVISEGPITGLVGGPQGIFFNNTPLMNPDGTWNFRGVTFQYLFGTPEQPALTGYPSATEDVAINTQVFYGNPVVQQLQSSTATQARVTVELPALFATNTQNGDVNPSTLELMIEVAEVTGTSVGAYSQVISDTINGKCTSPYQKSYVFNLPGAGGVSPITSWNIRVTKQTPESAVSTTINQLFWFSYDLITNNLIGYEDTAAIALQIDSEAFGSTLPTRTYLVSGIQVQVPENYNATTGTYATSGPGTVGGSWDYASFQPETSSNPAWILYDFLSNARYGLGISPQNLETCAIQLYQIAQYCDGLVPDGNGATERRYQLNGCFNQRANAFQVMQAIAATFRGQVYWAGGQVCVTCDMPQAPVKIYTAANVIDGNFVYESTSLKTRHTMVNSHFTDPSNQYLPGIEPVELPQQIANRGIFCTDILGFGVTSRGLAHRLGNWLLYTENFQTKVVTFSVSWDSAGVMPGNLIQIADPNVAGIRMGGRLRSNSTVNALALDMTFSPVAGQSYTASVILQDGTLAQNVLISSFSSGTTAQGVPYTIANLSSPLPNTPLAQAVFILQDAEIAATEWQVVGITETSRGIFEIVAAQYNPNKFALVETLPTLNVPSFSTVPASLIAPLAPPTNVSAATTLGGQGVTTLVQTICSWTQPVDARIVQYQVSVVNSEGTTVAVLVATGSSVEIDNLSPDTYYFSVRSLGSNGSTSSWAYSSPLVVTGQSANAPPAPTNLAASGGVSQVQLSWTASPQRDVQYYMVWRSSTTIAPAQPGSIAAMIGTTSGTAFADVDAQTLSPGTTWNYWVQAVTSTGIVGSLSAPASTVIAYISSSYFSSSPLPGFVTAIQPVGIWTGASLPATLGAGGNQTQLYWSVTGQLYSWNATANAYVAATPTPATLASGTLNSGVIVPGANVSGALSTATIPGSNLTGAIIAAQVTGALSSASLPSGNLTGAIVPTQLSFTDPTNLCLNPTFTVASAPSSNGWSSGLAAIASSTSGVPANPPAVNVGSDTAASVQYGTPFSVTPGQSFYFSAWVAGSAAHAAAIGMTFSDLNGANTSFVSAATATPSSTWTLITGLLTVPATTNGKTTAQGQITLTLAGTGTLPAVYWSQITCRQAVTSNLVGPATLSASQIASVNAASVVGTLVAAQIASINANQISGTLAAAQIASLAASQITGTLTASQIASVNAANIAGTIAANQVASIPSSQISGTLTASQIASVNAASIAGTIAANQVASIPAVQITGTITSTQIGANSVTTGAIAAGAITSSQIAANTILAANIASGTITATQIASGTLTSAQIIAGSITASSLTLSDTTNICSNPTGAITNPTNASLADGWNGVLSLASTASGVPSGAPTNNVIGTTQRDTLYGPGFQVNAGETYYVSVWVAGSNQYPGTAGVIVWNQNLSTELQIQSMFPYSGTWTPSTTWTQYTGQVTIAQNGIAKPWFQIANTGSITGTVYFTNFVFRKAASAELLVNGSITAGKIAAATITGNNIAAQTITASNLVSNTITALQITAGTITSTQIAAGTITAGNIASGTITATQIAAGTITSANIAAGTIQAGNIAAGAITAAQLSVGSPNNQIWNSCATLTDSGWIYAMSYGGSFSGTGAVAGTSYASNWLLSGGCGYYAAASVPSGATIGTSWVPSGTYGIPVVPGQTYIAQVAAACQNVPVQINIYWENSSGSTISASLGNTLPAGATAGTLLSDYAISWVVGVAPAGAASARVNIFSITTAAATNALVVWTQALFGQVPPNTVGPVMWTPGGVTQISGGQIISQSISATQIAANTITASQIAGSTITASQIAAATITGGNIAATTITGGNIAANTITAGNILSNTITATQIASGTITATQIQSSTITSSQIAASTILGSNIAAGTITATQIAASTITAAQIQSGTITTTQLAAGTLNASNITAGTLNAGVVIGSVANLGTVQITNANIANLTVGTSNIAANAVSAVISTVGGGTSISINVSNPNGYAIFLFCVVGAAAHSAGGGSINYNLYRGSTEIDNFYYNYTITGYLESNTACILDQPGAGTYSYTLYENYTTSTQSYQMQLIALILNK